MHTWDRRSILLHGLALGAGTTVASCKKEAPSAPAERVTEALETVLPVLIAVAEHLLPSDDLGPGAREANVGGYLAQALDDPRLRGTRSTLVRGAVWLDRAAREERGRPFVALSFEEKEDFVQRLASDTVRPGGFTPSAFLRIMLALTLEGFLGDPRHGGNKDEVGWRFAGGIDWAGRRGGR